MSGIKQKHDHEERHHLFIEEMRAGIVKSYVDMLHRLNADIVSVVKRARGLTKGGTVLTIGNTGMTDPSALARTLDIDISKATTKTGKQRKDPYGHISYTKHTKSGAVISVGSKGVKPGEETKGDDDSEQEKKATRGQWYADEHGNVIFSTRSMGTYTKKLSQQEAAELNRRTDIVVSQLDAKSIAALSKEMGWRYNVDVLSTLQHSTARAAALGITAEESFTELYVEGMYDESGEGTWRHKTREALAEEAAELYTGMISRFHEVSESGAWKRASAKSLAKRQAADGEAVLRLRDQRKVVKGSFEDLMSGDVSSESIKQLGIIYDLGLVTTPQTLRDAEALVGADHAARARWTARIDPDRYNALMRYVPGMEIEQQIAFSCATIAMHELATELDDVLYDRDAFWETVKQSPLPDKVREYQKLQGNEYTDEQWALVREKIFEAARAVADQMLDFNHDRGGFILKALIHRQTDLRKMYLKTGAKETDRLKGLQEKHNITREQALAAQQDDNYVADEHIKKGFLSIAKKLLKKTGKKLEIGLFPYQRRAVNWMRAVKSGILAYDTGMGKTPISIAYISSLLADKKVKRGIIVLPPTLISQWPGEIENWRPGSSVQVVTGSIKGPDGGGMLADYNDRVAQLKAINSGDIKADFVVVSSGLFGKLSDEYAEAKAAAIKDIEAATGKKATPADIADAIMRNGLLGKDPFVEELRKMDGAFVYDEIHMQGLKTPTADRHLIAQHILNDKEYKFGMSATPMTVDPGDLFHMSNLFHPGSAGEHVGKFVGRLVETQEEFDIESQSMRRVVVSKDRKEMAAAKREISPYVFMARKTSKSIVEEMTAAGQKLPPVQATAHPIDMSEEAFNMQTAITTSSDFDTTHAPYVPYAEDYEPDAVIYPRLLAEKGERVAMRTLATRQFIRKQKLAISPKLLDKTYKGPQPKIDYAVNLVQSHFNNPDNANKPLIIFSHFKDSLKLMQDELINRPETNLPEHFVLRYDGDTAQDDRGVAQAAINDGKAKVILIGIKAGGAGLNLQEASSTGIFLDKPWSPADMQQAVGRFWRTGQQAPMVNVHHMKVLGSTDEGKYDRLNKRISTFDSLAYADAGDDYLSGEIVKDIDLLVGSFDSKATEWTEEQRKTMYNRAGLNPGDLLPLPSMKALQKDYDIKAYKDTLATEDWVKFGYDRIQQMAVINNLRLKSKRATPRQHTSVAHKISKFAQNYMKAAKVAADHPVAQFIGTDFDWESDGINSVGGGGLHARGKGVKRPQKNVSPTVAAARKGRVGALKTEEQTKKEVAEKPAKRITKVSPSSSFKIAASAVKKNPYEKLTRPWVYAEAVRRTRPVSYADAVKKISAWMYDHYKKEGNLSYTRKSIREAVEARLKQGILNKLARDGVLEVAS